MRGYPLLTSSDMTNAWRTLTVNPNPLLDLNSAEEEITTNSSFFELDSADYRVSSKSKISESKMSESAFYIIDGSKAEPIIYNIALSNEEINLFLNNLTITLIGHRGFKSAFHLIAQKSGETPTQFAERKLLTLPSQQIQINIEEFGREQKKIIQKLKEWHWERKKENSTDFLDKALAETAYAHAKKAAEHGITKHKLLIRHAPIDITFLGEDAANRLLNAVTQEIILQLGLQKKELTIEHIIPRIQPGVAAEISEEIADTMLASIPGVTALADRFARGSRHIVLNLRSEIVGQKEISGNFDFVDEYQTTKTIDDIIFDPSLSLPPRTSSDNYFYVGVQGYNITNCGRFITMMAAFSAEFLNSNFDANARTLSVDDFKECLAVTSADTCETPMHLKKLLQRMKGKTLRVEAQSGQTAQTDDHTYAQRFAQSVTALTQVSFLIARLPTAPLMARHPLTVEPLFGSS